MAPKLAVEQWVRQSSVMSMPLKALSGALFVMTAAASGCSDGTAPERESPGGVDLALLFAPATPAEVAAVETEWANRTIQVADVTVVETLPMTLGGVTATVHVVSHRVDGVLHYGGVVVPDGSVPGTLPVVVYSHGGDSGVDLGELQLVAAGLGSLAADIGIVVPSFRAEHLRSGTSSWLSEGDPSPWDRDVDDALALIDAAASVAPALDTDRIVVVGFSRGAGVGLLMAVRDPRIDGVVDFFGPTDFFDTYAREIVEDALAGSVRDLPGLSILNERFIGPFGRGELPLDAVRLELVRRSAALFASDLPAIQIHHGTSDAVVAVSQAERLILALEARAWPSPPHQAYLYPGGQHNPLSLPGSFERARSFLVDVLGLD